MRWQDLLRPGETCWQLAPAQKLAVLIDSEAYFRAFKQAALRARRSILIIGWDVNSRLGLEFPETAMQGVPNRLGPFLTHLLVRSEALRINVLHWNSPLLFKLDREWLPRLRIDWLSHPRARYALDNQHPLGAAHHQKIVVIDDALAFVGGIDFAIERLDGRAHLPGDPRRRLPDGTIPQPVHDIQFAVGGPAARVLGDIARERWQVATGQRLAPAGPGAVPWPEGLTPDLRDVEVAIARTRPAWKSLGEVREIEALFTAAIRTARDWIYIETQYLTAWSVAQALRARLEQAGGPEIVLLLPREPTGWIEQTAMGIGQRRILAMLRDVDHERRLRVYVPMLGAAGEVPLKVHSKTMIIDGRFVTVGSANLNNRSMGLDTECNLALAVEAGAKPERVLAGLRDDLLAEHLGCRPADVARTIAREGSMIAAVEALRGPGRSLVPFPETPPAELDALIAEAGVLDPSETAAPERLADGFVEHPVGRRQVRNALVGLLATAAVFAALVTLWRAEPGAGGAPLERIEALSAFGADWWRAAAATLAAIVIGGLLLPLMPLVIVTGLVHGPWTGFCLAFAGALGSAVLGYGLGVALGRDRLRWVMRGRLEYLAQRIGRRGMLSIAVGRLLPFAPFPLINVAAGTARVRLSDYLLGTALGVAPGILVFTLFSGLFRSVLFTPGPGNLAGLLAVLVAVTAFALWLWRRFVNRLTVDDG